ncbi:two-component system regulatory protein YycI [Halobacillus seohaensis]|uniref:Two-component system regulatory protein YycI n=1 Tax=Halobacillus seohaensis TaxID=447421 RepID=A0ABW2EHU0_9BACI
MQWGQIKTLFILSFLILDLFLLQQFLTKQNDSELETVQESMYEDSPTDGEITVADSVPDEAPEVSFLIASPSKFTESQLDRISNLSDQNVRVYEEELLISTLDEPIDLGDDEESIVEVISEYVPFSSQYSYWGWNEEEDKILLFQTNNSRTIYYNPAGVLTVDVEDGAMTGYQVSQLGVTESEEDEQLRDLLDPSEVIGILYDNQSISTGDEITNMTVGYHSAAGSDPTQVFAPTWKVTVNSEEDYFVNAVTAEGRIIDIEESEFIEEISEYFQEKIVDSEEDVITNTEDDEETTGDNSNE